MSSEIIPNSIILFTRAQLGRTATPTPEVEIESCPDCPRAFPFWNGVPFLLLNHSIMSTIWHPLSLVAKEQGIIDSISCFKWLTYPEVTDMSFLASQTFNRLSPCGRAQWSIRKGYLYQAWGIYRARDWMRFIGNDWKRSKINLKDGIG